MSEARYREALHYLYNLEPRGVRLELDRMRAALALRGDPHRASRYVHVAGTNGKGSVASMVEAVLRAAGYRTGLYTSPHLHRFGERIRIGGEPLGRARVTSGVEALREGLAAPDAPRLTFFEMATLLAFEAFRDADCDVVVVEVGLGGRLDATNVIRPELGVITHVALDHTNRLGDRVEQVAYEKAGILEPETPAVVGVRNPEAARVIRERARELQAPLCWIDHDFRVESSQHAGRCDVVVGDERIRDIVQALPGAHQRDNLAVAVAASRALCGRGFDVSHRALRQGLEQVRWPGRLEYVGDHPRFLLDAAHNPDACAVLAAHLDAQPRRGPRVLLFGAMVDKDHEGMLRAFDGRADARVYAAAPLSRAASPETLAALRPGECAATVRDGLARARERAGPEGLVVVAGSIFLMAEVRRLLRNGSADPPIAM